VIANRTWDCRSARSRTPPDAHRGHRAASLLGVRSGPTVRRNRARHRVGIA